MPLITCPDCGNELSTSATSCPNCGRPRDASCPRCGAHDTVQKVDGLKGFENVVALVLLILCIIPGIAYYFDRTRLSYCTNCHHRVANA